MEKWPSRWGCKFLQMNCFGKAVSAMDVSMPSRDSCHLTINSTCGIQSQGNNFTNRNSRMSSAVHSSIYSNYCVIIVMWKQRKQGQQENNLGQLWYVLTIIKKKKKTLRKQDEVECIF